MKRNIFLALVAAITISLVATGAAFAQGIGPGGNGTSTDTSVKMEVTLSNYMPHAMAEVLGLSVEEVNSALASGETFYTIALAQGYMADQISALMTSVRAKAIDLASFAGTITADRAAFLLTSPAGVCDGTCIPKNNTTALTNQYSYTYNTGDGSGIPQSTRSGIDAPMSRRGGQH